MREVNVPATFGLDRKCSVPIVAVCVPEAYAVTAISR
jgi:hypothetical protein